MSTRIAAHVVGALLLILGALACRETMESYRLDQVTELSATVQGTDQLKISYRPMSESLYFSPGIAVTTKTDHIEVRFVRCGIKDKCQVTHAAQVGNQGTLSVVIPRPTLPVRVSDGKESKVVFSGS